MKLSLGRDYPGYEVDVTSSLKEILLNFFVIILEVSWTNKINCTSKLYYTVVVSSLNNTDQCPYLFLFE